MSTAPTSLTTATEVYTFPHSSAIAYTFTWTDLGPLTTTFTPPAACSSAAQGDPSVLSNGLQVKGYCGGVPDWLSCQPYSSKVSSIFLERSAVRYVSPGLYCPAGYSTAKALTFKASDLLYTTLGQSTLLTTGTHIFCCPSGYSSSSNYCKTSITTATTVNVCNSVALNQKYGTATFTNLSGRVQVTEIGIPTPYSWSPADQTLSLHLNILPIYMIHQQSDLPQSTLSNSSLPKPSLPSSGSPKSGLSTGDKIAIGVVVPVVVVLALIMGGLFIMKRLRRRRQQRWIEATAPRTEAPSDHDFASMSFLAGEERKNVELEGDNALEMDGRRRIAELEGRERAAELEGRARAAELDAREVAELEGTAPRTTRDRSGSHRNSRP